MNKSDNEKQALLSRLRRKRAGGRLMKVVVGVQLANLKKRGVITQSEYDYVMGLEKK